MSDPHPLTSPDATPSDPSTPSTTVATLSSLWTVLKRAALVLLLAFIGWLTFTTTVAFQELQSRYQPMRDALNANLEAATCTKDGNAYIGESQERTLKCGWGTPQRINRTTTGTLTGALTREQWVYGGRNYLYFIDGRLTTIQN